MSALLILFVFLVAGSKLTAQDYTPANETVPGISRYEALLSLKQNLAKCPGCFKRTGEDYDYRKKTRLYDIKNGDVDYLQLKNLSLISDKKLQLKFMSGYIQMEISWDLDINNIAVPTSRFHDNRYHLSFQSLEPKPKHQGRYVVWMVVDSFETAKSVADAIFLLKNTDQQTEDLNTLAKFKPVAEQYRNLVIKPDLNEEARKYLVQATTATDEKSYEEAIDLLGKAIKIDPAYPQAHFNQALLWAQVSIYGAAILEMKKYLMLVPDAADARASQDKIYEWERKLSQ